MSKNHLYLVLSFVLFFGQAQAQTCSNDLEEQLSQLPEILTQERAPSDEALDARCISSSMAVFYEWTQKVRMERAAAMEPEVGHYGYCESAQQKKVRRSHTAPCKSATYVNVVQNAYNDVTNCLGLDPKRLFAITAVESGFHINTYSLSGQDIGIGQLIPQAITEVNAFWDDSIKELEQSDKASCQNLRPMIAALESAPSEGSKQACSMMALPENPVRNLLYLGLLHKFNEQKMKQYFDQSRMAERLTQLTGDAWTEEELFNLQEVLVFLAYNAGFHGAKTIFEAFVSEKQNNLVLWNQQHKDLYLPTIDFYLRAMDLQAQGKMEEAEALLNQRQQLYVELAKLEDGRQELFISKSVFFANMTPGSFGDYLVKTNSSNYLDILLRRIAYIEKMLEAPGLCTNASFLTGQ